MGLKTTIASFSKPTIPKIVVKNTKIRCNASRILRPFLCFLLAGAVGKIHTSLWILNISRKKSATQKSRDFCQMFVISKRIPYPRVWIENVK
jgi:hypothetical protein